MKEPQLFEVSIDPSILVDPNFEKNYSDFFPLKFSTLNEKRFSMLTQGARVLLIAVVAQMYARCSLDVVVDVVQLPEFRRLDVTKLFLELSNFNYLRASKIKENKIKENKKHFVNFKQKTIEPDFENLAIDLVSKIFEICETRGAKWSQASKTQDGQIFFECFINGSIYSAPTFDQALQSTLGPIGSEIITRFGGWVKFFQEYNTANRGVFRAQTVKLAVSIMKIQNSLGAAPLSPAPGESPNMEATK